MTSTSLRRALTLCFVCLLTPLAATAQQQLGYWRALGTTARGVTGDLALSEYRIAINFTNYTMAQIRDLTPDEAAAVFSASTPGGRGDLYHLNIPGTAKMLHKNTLCGGEDVQYMLTYAHGKELQVAFFSGAKIPALTGEAMVNNPALCGTYSYAR